jgi:hypothetical protein
VVGPLNLVVLLTTTTQHFFDNSAIIHQDFPGTMASLQEKIDALYKELEEVVEQHNQAVQVQNAAKEKAISIQGALNALRELQEDEASEAPTEAA